MTIEPKLSCLPKLGLRQRQRQERDDAILNAAFVLIAERGYEAMTMDELAERVGISKPTLYHHFSSKQVIAVRALVRLMEQTTQSMRAVDPTLPPLARLERVVRSLITDRLSPECAAFVQAKQVLAGDMESHPDYRQALAQLSAEIEGLFVAAQKAGQVDDTLPGSLLTHMLFTLMRGDQYDEMIADGRSSSEEIADTLLTVFFRGIRTETK